MENQRRVHLTMKWVVSFSILRLFGPRRATAMLRAGHRHREIINFRRRALQVLGRPAVFTYFVRWRQVDKVHLRHARFGEARGLRGELPGPSLWDWVGWRRTDTTKLRRAA